MRDDGSRWRWCDSADLLTAGLLDEDHVAERTYSLWEKATRVQSSRVVLAVILRPCSLLDRAAVQPFERALVLMNTDGSQVRTETPDE